MVLYVEKRNYDRVIADLEAALRIDPNVANARNSHDIVLRARGY
ncbi:hypothetical protein FACS1894147_03710 [Spirochaetia bacterium]|nr:hypothetical protein FACS1894147_03710 [Spirochaetia bacterium]